MSTSAAWEYHDTQDDPKGQTWHVWTRRHQEGFIAYQITRQPSSGGFTTPTGNACYTSREALAIKTGINTRQHDSE